jgi:hypothetical protein
VRQAQLFHGTTASRARLIEETQKFERRTTYFALGASNRDLAEIFAARSSSRFPPEGGPAVLAVDMPEEAIQRLRRLGLIRAGPFDPEDRPELRLRTQWILEPGGVDILNRELTEVRRVAYVG